MHYDVRAGFTRDFSMATDHCNWIMHTHISDYTAKKQILKHQSITEVYSQSFSGEMANRDVDSIPEDWLTTLAVDSDDRRSIHRDTIVREIGETLSNEEVLAVHHLLQEKKCLKYLPDCHFAKDTFERMYHYTGGYFNGEELEIPSAKDIVELCFAICSMYNSAGGNRLSQKDFRDMNWLALKMMIQDGTSVDKVVGISKK